MHDPDEPTDDDQHIVDACQDALDRARSRPTGDDLGELVDHLHELLGETTQMSTDDLASDAQELLLQAAETIAVNAADYDDLACAMWVPQMTARTVSALAQHPASSPELLRELADRVRDTMGHLGLLKQLPGTPRRVALLADLYGRAAFPAQDLIDRWNALTPVAQTTAETLAATWRPRDPGFLDVAERTAA